MKTQFQEALAREPVAGDAKDMMQLEVAREGASARHQSPFESVLGSRTFREGWRPPEGSLAARGRGPGQLTSRLASDPVTPENALASLGDKGEAVGRLGGKFSQDALQGGSKYVLGRCQIGVNAMLNGWVVLNC